ncbi:2Fe-2S ferredoxin [Pontibacter aydingkolensis]|uniref:2Fe-2S iron-sulfur cluster binding domain-containing protein n=1 Tax=Pontibacter aydingkolensis TaxID=1911536 RepID=A0ABS7CVR7_9BACT|nr:2Fe-2S iron-sulfur cluster-binding protein [Pontibacter aydingkolensis]MBW7467958.1 2Fe-2S iron-sulfur cluster binding domain-containing protein [Pontibacter aydingkolensis]
MEDTININVELQDGSRVTLEAPTDMGLSVMEVMKANELNVPAICGGMAICATCHVEVLQSGELPEPSDDEAYMLETLPHATATSRLSCQLKVKPELDGLVVRLMPEA